MNENTYKAKMFKEINVLNTNNLSLKKIFLKRPHKKFHRIIITLYTNISNILSYGFKIYKQYDQ